MKFDLEEQFSKLMSECYNGVKLGTNQYAESRKVFYFASLSMFASMMELSRCPKDEWCPLLDGLKEQFDKFRKEIADENTGTVS